MVLLLDLGLLSSLQNDLFLIQIYLIYKKVNQSFYYGLILLTWKK